MQHQQDNKGEAWRRHAQAVYGREKGGCGMPNCWHAAAAAVRKVQESGHSWPPGVGCLNT